MRTWAWLVLVLIAAAGWYLLRPVDPSLPPQAPPAAVAADALPAARTPDTEVADATPATVPDASLAESARQLAASIEASGLLVHGQQDTQACLANTGKAVLQQKATVHRWVDAAGIIHYSDQPPGADASGVRRIEIDGTPPVIVKAHGYDVNLPDQVRQRALADALAIERVLRGSLGIEGNPGLALDIEFIRGAETYAERVGNPALASSAGAYSSRLRTIHIRLQDRDEANFIILRHEITHALLHERVGHLPVTLNEGLAGYFERLEVAGMGAQIAFADARAALATARVSDDGADELVDLLATEGPAFYAEGREARYVRAFALVALLMSRVEGRAALTAILVAQRADSCRPVDAAPILDAAYPGGLRALAADWSRWLRDPPAAVQAF